MSSSSSISNSPCAACKIQRRKCTQECVFAPYFPPDNPQKFSNVHKVFGASNVSKLLNELKAEHREDAVNSLAYEADARLRDPVYGCVGLISILQHRLKQVQTDLVNAKQELATYIGPQAMFPIFQTSPFMPQGIPSPSTSTVYPYNTVPPMMSGFQTGPPPRNRGQLVIREPQAQAQPPQVQAPAPQSHLQIFEAQQVASAISARDSQQEFLMRGGGLDQKMVFQQQLQQYQPPLGYIAQPVNPQSMGRFETGFDPRVGPPDHETAAGFIGQMGSGVSPMEPTLGLGSGFDNNAYNQVQPVQAESDQQQHQHHSSLNQLHDEQVMFETPQSPLLQLGPQPQLWNKLEGGEDRRVGPPSF
ncbi:Lateral organ boundaries domain containing protein [Parasponia andersonii]|uniref:Lateral organ boundaries domain containing protein n=1 Tax=Parasponia andersonii TaxID=3476 RepID=A0A2P5ADH0_PARAD|nr:Lateral organ boundaries domain containing protein [Parasponia andersonii]